MLMSEASSAGRIVRFGMFEADLVSGELRKNGTRIRLQEQPFQVLGMLLERPGEMVTREDLRHRLWPADTFVDFDHSLNTAVNKLREALGDAAANPRFVQTVARRGYRFIAPVQESDRPANGAGAAGGQEPGLGKPGEAVPTAELLHAELEIPTPRRGLIRRLFLLIQAMYLIFYLVALFRWQEVREIADSFLPGWGATSIVIAVLVTAGIGIPLRCYLISSVGFDHRRFGENFRRLFPFLLAMDQLWAVAPFLLAQWIGFGAAFAATALLLYLPFSERALVRMVYPVETH
jgi:cholera toxin transcriptional activator